MADRVLRDQCVHGRCDEHWWPDIFPVQVGHTYTGGAELCPGGREVTIDYEAATRQLAEALQRWGFGWFWWFM